MSGPLLPPAFSDLEPFARTWCLPTEPERWARRQSTPMEELQAFYDAAFPRAEEAMAHCDAVALHDMPDDARHLLQLLCSLALVSYAVEVWGQQQPVDAGVAIIDRIGEPSP